MALEGVGTLWQGIKSFAIAVKIGESPPKKLTKWISILICSNHQRAKVDFKEAKSYCNPIGSWSIWCHYGLVKFERVWLNIRMVEAELFKWKLLLIDNQAANRHRSNRARTRSRHLANNYSWWVRTLSYLKQLQNAIYRLLLDSDLPAVCSLGYGPIHVLWLVGPIVPNWKRSITSDEFDFLSSDCVRRIRSMLWRVMNIVDWSR